jgi:tetratricopeptide (TPR) repeat protein
LYRDRGDIARRLNKLAEAKQAFEESWRLALELRQIGQEDPKLMLMAIGGFRNLLELAVAGQTKFSDEPAAQRLAELIEQLPEQLAAENVGRRIRREFAVELIQLGNLFERQGRLELALKLSRQGVALTEQLIEEDRANLDHQFNLQVGLDLLGRLLAEDQQLDEARKVYQNRLKALNELSGRLIKSAYDPVELAQLTFAKAQTNNTLARISLIQNEPSQALAELDAAKKLIAALISEFPQHRAVFEQELNETQRMLAKLSFPPAIAEKPE